MTMGFKYQLLSCSHPQEVLLVTLNHLYELRSKVEEAPAVTDLVDEVIRQVNAKYAGMSTADYGYLKQVAPKDSMSRLAAVGLPADARFEPVPTELLQLRRAAPALPSCYSSRRCGDGPASGNPIVSPSTPRRCVASSEISG